MGGGAKRPLLHSAAVHPPGARRRDEDLDLSENIQVTIVLRSRTDRDQRRREVKELAEQLPLRRAHLGVEEYVQRYGARQEDLEAVTRFAAGHGLRVVESSAGRRCVAVGGSVGQMDQAFQTESGVYETDHPVHELQGTELRTYRSHKNHIHLPPELHEVVRAVIGMDDRPLVEPHGRLGFAETATDRSVLEERYRFPAGTDGTGQRIGILAPNGGFHREDVEPYLGRGRRISVVELDGAKNDPSDHRYMEAIWPYLKAAYEGQPPPPFEDFPKDLRGDEKTRQYQFTAEITADIQNAAAFAPGADLTVYFMPDDLQGKYTALTTALVDPQAPSVISISWGSHEARVPRSTLWALDDLFEFAALRGVTICCSSGDDGDGRSTTGDNGEKDGPPRVHFPAASPHVLSCGGTQGHGKDSEVWEEHFGGRPLASGGGVSEVFGPPWWMGSADVPGRTGGKRGRGVPDVAGKADMKEGVLVTIGGITMPMGGTSMVAPMWAALVARLNQSLGMPMGYLTPLLYLDRGTFKDATRPVEMGKNGVYKAYPGWDACCGWGSPDAEVLARALSGKKPD